MRERVGVCWCLTGERKILGNCGKLFQQTKFLATVLELFKVPGTTPKQIFRILTQRNTAVSLTLKMKKQVMQLRSHRFQKLLATCPFSKK